mmetsp:Transcript_9293/g.20232  ORF Transcript_9293/g.20232 Transcript_9293/m.20232 type:complete len:391 (-) Transcript_9293:43-1215(-)
MLTEEDESSSSDGNSNSRKKKKQSDTVNAAACRRHRAKRKQQAAELKTRNKELEENRDIYAARIADLQTEIQALRAGGAIDIAKENQLLRAEIKRHKRFIQQFVHVAQTMTQNQPPPIEESYREISQNTGSGIAQVVGLAYASTVDPSWKFSQLLTGANNATVYYQLLPHGATYNTATRINIRIDFGEFPAPAPIVGLLQWKAVSDPIAVKALDQEKSLLDGARRTTQDILPTTYKEFAQQLDDQDKIAAFRNIIYPVGGGEYSYTTLSTNKITDIYPAAFNIDTQQKDRHDGICVKAHVTCSVSAEGTPLLPTEKKYGSAIYGHISQPTPDNKSTLLTSIFSYPTKHGTLFNSPGTLIRKNNTLAAFYEEMMTVVYQAHARKYTHILNL